MELKFCWNFVAAFNLDVPGMVGTIDQTCNILNVAEDAYDAASSLCDGQSDPKTYLDLNPMINIFRKIIVCAYS